MEQQAQQLQSTESQLAKQHTIRHTLELHLKDLYHDYKRLQQQHHEQAEASRAGKEQRNTLQRALDGALAANHEQAAQVSRVQEQLAQAQVCQ